jgi:SAM-dependent methyltransferase
VRYDGYDSKKALLSRFCRKKRILHVGAVGCTLESTQNKVTAAEDSVHSFLSRIGECVGVDVDEAGVKALAEAGIFSNIIAADVNSLTKADLPLDFVDVIVAGDVIEHLSNPGSALDSFHRFCGENTRLILTTPNAMGLPNFLRYLAGRFVDTPDHVCTFTAFSLVNLLRRHGWVVEHLFLCHQFAAKDHTNQLSFLLGRRIFKMLPRLGGTLFVVARERPSNAASEEGGR